MTSQFIIMQNDMPVAVMPVESTEGQARLYCAKLKEQWCARHDSMTMGEPHFWNTEVPVKEEP